MTAIEDMDIGVIGILGSHVRAMQVYEESRIKSRIDKKKGQALRPDHSVTN
jgi:hypothetical protein